MPGKLIGVGIGPGDPELLTLKAVRLIQQAPVVAYTVNSKGSSYVRDTAAAWISTKQTELPLLLSMSPERAIRQDSRRKAASQVLQVLNNGLDVAFITEGDPLLYSTFQHILSAMPPDIEIEICPGISSMFAAAAATRFPLAIEEQAVIIAPAQTANGHLAEWLQQGYSLVLFKAAHHLREITDEIQRSGVPCNTVLVKTVSSEKEIIVRDMQAWSLQDAPYFSIVLLAPRSRHN